MTTVNSQTSAWLASCLLIVTALLLQACEQKSTPPKYDSVDYNVILISIDTLRADRLGAYGYKKETSPNIDTFAADSILFESSIAQAPSTLPSHASIFTGLFPVNHGAFAALQTPIPTKTPTIPEIMRDAGFRTISFNGGGLVGAVYGFGRGFEHYVTERDNDRFRYKVDAATDWLDDNGDDKFFMFLHTYEVHDPYAPDPEYLALFETDYAGSISNNIDSKEIGKINSDSFDLSAADIEHVNNAYDAEIRSMDDAFGRLIAYLKDNNLYDNTVIIFTSDHGEEFGEHGYVGRHFFTLYDELIHVPLIVKMPDSQRAGVMVGEQVRGVDILPTLLDLLAINFEPDIDGESLISLMLGEETEALIAVSQQDTSDPLPPTSIRTNTRKLILSRSILKDSEASGMWVKDKMEFQSDASTLTIPLASPGGERKIRALINGKRTRQFTISSERQNFSVILKVGGQPGDADAENLDYMRRESNEQQQVTLESLSPCVNAADAGIDTELDCVSFRVFSPQEFYLLDTDPNERDNRYGDAAHQDEINELRGWLKDDLAGKSSAPTEKIELDEETQRQLKSLGYLN
jgi:arylsulfatase A-like enzyme